MRISQYRELVPAFLQHRRRVLALGKPGVGKTQAVEETCRELGWDCIVSPLALDDPSTIRGYPGKPAGGNGGPAQHTLFESVYRVFNATKKTLWFLDDAGQATESTLKSVMRPLQCGELDGKKLPDCVSILAASNDVGHGAGVYGMIEPLKSRFHSIITVETHVDDVVQFGLSRGWPAWILAFLRNSPESLSDWKPSKSMQIDGGCPRGYQYLAEWDLAKVDDAEIWAGCIGRGNAAKAAAFKELQGDLPDVDQILLDPDSCPVPENPSARFLVSMALASRMTAGTFGTALQYLRRLPGSFRAYSVRDAFKSEVLRIKEKTVPKDYRPIHTSREYTAWVASKDGQDIMAAAG